MTVSDLPNLIRAQTIEEHSMPVEGFFFFFGLLNTADGPIEKICAIFVTHLQKHFFTIVSHVWCVFFFSSPENHLLLLLNLCTLQHNLYSMVGHWFTAEGT